MRPGRYDGTNNAPLVKDGLYIMVDRSDMLAALTADYCNVYIVDLARDLGQIVKLEGWDIDVAHDAPERLRRGQDPRA